MADQIVLGGLAPMDRVARFTLGLAPGDIPETALRWGALMALDTLGIAAAAGPMEAGTLARETAVRIFGAADPAHQARLMFDGRRASIAGAAFALATQIDNLDGHDGYNPSRGHIGVAVIPALAALAEGAPGLTGPEALAALIVGYEVAGRAGTSLHARAHDYHSSGAWNALGVAAMAARMRGLSAVELREALGIAEYHGPRSQVMREVANPTTLHDGSGWGALAGVSAAVMAGLGMTGAPAVTVEAPEAAEHWADLGDFWQIEHQYVKPYPVCRWAHAPLDAVSRLMAEHGFTHGDVAEVRVNTFDYALDLVPGVPDTSSKAQYALIFPVAAMLVHGRVGIGQISGAGLRDPEVAAMVPRIRVRAAERHQARYPAGRWADVEVELTDGRVFASGDTHARGGPEHPFGEAEVVAKFMEYAAPALGEARAAAIRDATLGLTKPGSRFGDLARHLYDAP